MTHDGTGQPSGDRTIGLRYREAVDSFVDLASSLTADDWATPVPCTPGWTARDVLSHVAGVTDDVLAGRVDGVATDPWTSSQVERYGRLGVDDLLAQWDGQVAEFAALIEALGEQRPPFDCHAHEHDVRHALGRPGNRESELVADAVPGLLGRLDDVPVSIRVDFADGSALSTGQGDADRRLRLATTRFEIFRSIVGRRTSDQVRALDWTGDLDAVDEVVESWFAFGPSEIEIVE